MYTFRHLEIDSNGVECLYRRHIAEARNLHDLRRFVVECLHGTPEGHCATFFVERGDLRVLVAALDFNANNQLAFMSIQEDVDAFERGDIFGAACV